MRRVLIPHLTFFSARLCVANLSNNNERAKKRKRKKSALLGPFLFYHRHRLLFPWILLRPFFFFRALFCTYIRWFACSFAKMMTIRYGISFVLWLKVHISYYIVENDATNKISCGPRTQGNSGIKREMAKINPNQKKTICANLSVQGHLQALSIHIHRFECIKRILRVSPMRTRDDANLFLLIRPSFNFAHATSRWKRKRVIWNGANKRSWSLACFSDNLLFEQRCCSFYCPLLFRVLSERFTERYFTRAQQYFFWFVLFFENANQIRERESCIIKNSDSTKQRYWCFAHL